MGCSLIMKAKGDGDKEGTLGMRGKMVMEIMVRVSGREVGWFYSWEEWLPGGIRVSIYTAACTKPPFVFRGLG